MTAADWSEELSEPQRGGGFSGYSFGRAKEEQKHQSNNIKTYFLSKYSVHLCSVLSFQIPLW